MCVEKEEMLQNGVLFLWIFKLFFKQPKITNFFFFNLSNSICFWDIARDKGLLYKRKLCELLHTLLNTSHYHEMRQADIFIF